MKELFQAANCPPSVGIRLSLNRLNPLRRGQQQHIGTTPGEQPVADHTGNAVYF
jgi:hypothetical protein